MFNNKLFATAALSAMAAASPDTLTNKSVSFVTCNFENVTHTSTVSGSVYLKQIFNNVNGVPINKLKGAGFAINAEPNVEHTLSIGTSCDTHATYWDLVTRTADGYGDLYFDSETLPLVTESPLQLEVLVGTELGGELMVVVLNVFLES